MHLLFLFSFLLVVGASDFKGSGSIVPVTDENWAQILDGEWMIEFFAPWCPACRNLQSTWESFATWSRDLDIRVGQVDITNSPGLSGRFMITALPTIYHVTAGQFRQYKGPRTKEDLLSFIEEKKWERVEPISAWQSPASLQMSLLSQFYRVSMGLRNVMSLMTEEWGVPVWGAYIAFGGATIIVGLVLGLILVFIIDCIYPQRRPCAAAAVGEKAESLLPATSSSASGDQEMAEAAADDLDLLDVDEDESETEPVVAPSAKVESSPASARKRRARKD